MRLSSSERSKTMDNTWNEFNEAVNTPYEIRFVNCNNIKVTEYRKYPWQAHELARELQDAEIWYKDYCIKVYKMEE
jgi:hypothetical protein